MMHTFKRVKIHKSVIVTFWFAIQKIYSKVYSIWCAKIHHDVTSLKLMEWFKIWTTKYLKFLKLCLNDYILRNYHFFKQSRPLILLDSYNGDNKKFFFWTTLVLEHPFLNIPCFSGSFAVSSYCSTPDGLKLIQLAVEKSDIERVSSNKTLYHLLINWLTSNPDLFFIFKLDGMRKNLRSFSKTERIWSLKVIFSLPFGYHKPFAYLIYLHALVHTFLAYSVFMMDSLATWLACLH